MKIRGIITTTVLFLALIIISTTTAAATSCDCGDICANQSGWWRDCGAFNASETPMQAAADSATADETICAPQESYYENPDIETLHLTLTGEGASDMEATQTELPPEASTDWWTAVQEDISKSEYDVTWQKETQLPDINAAYQAPNRAHNLRTYFEPENIRITPRTSTDWVFGLSLVGYGFADDVRPVPGAEMSVLKNRVEYQRGYLTEWYVNSEDGLEQGFTIDAPPESESQPEQESWIAIKMDILGDLDANMNSASDAVELTTTGGVGVLRYGKLHAFDAMGRELDARFALPGSEIEILVNTSDAVYPITIDPLAQSPAWTAESNQNDARFGNSVASAGDVNGDGYSDVIVGAFLYDNDETNEGRAYVYHGSATGLSTSFAWTAESNQTDAYFGISVASAGDVNGDGYSDVIVGAHYYDNGETNEGRAYVYHGSATGLLTGPAWTAESNQYYAHFGCSVASAGDVNGDGYSDVIVGAYGYTNGQSSEGRAYVYRGSATGLSTSSAWTAESNQDGARFGYSVASAGDVNGDGYNDVIVGAYWYDNDQGTEGRAYVYHGSATGLLTGPAWTAESNQNGAQFGWSVASAGDVNGDGYSDVIVGAYYYDNGETDEGRAYVYHGLATGLSTSYAWTAESNQSGADFGISVASAGDVNGDGYSDVIVCAGRYDNGEDKVGRAYVYHGSATGLSTSYAWTADSNQSYASFGRSVASAGDVNGDGYSDVIVGAGGYNNDDEGRAYVYHGSATGLSTNYAWTAESNQSHSWFGCSVASAGDVNGDGYSDVIVGAGSYENGETNEGRAYIYHGSATGLSTSCAWTAEGNQIDARFGRSVASAGDVNGDGYSDVIIGADYYNHGEDKVGRAYVYHGSATGLSTSCAWTAKSNQIDACFGRSVASAGDVNGDGYSDVIVGAYLYDNGETNEGRAFVYHGSATGLSTSYAWTAESNQTAWFGYSVASAGDVNGDGYSDVIVGARFYSNGETYEGRAYVYHGSATGLSTSYTWTAESNQVDARFGRSVASAGDVNGDGYSDVIVGAHVYDNGETDEGRAFVYHGNGGSGLSLIPGQRKSDNSAPIAHLGRSDSMHEFRLTALGRTPYGRSRVKLEWEVKPLGTPFDGTGTQKSASWIDTGTAGADLNELVSSLTEDTCYHWRMRILYHPVSTPFQPHSRWFSQPGNGWQETDLRTLPENYVPPLPNLVFAITPNSRLAQVGTPVTIFMSVINAGTGSATDVSISQASSLPATISYQAWNGVTLIGTPDTPMDIGPGETVNYVLVIDATAEFVSSAMTFDVSGTNSGSAPISGVNTLTMAASTTPYADVIMMSTSLDVSTAVNTATAFALATTNVGSASATDVSLVVDIPSSVTGLVYQVNETNPDGSIKGPATGLAIPVGGTPTFAVFLTPTQVIDYDPANNRIMLKLVDGSGKVVGAQSVAVSTT